MHLINQLPQRLRSLRDGRTTHGTYATNMYAYVRSPPRGGEGQYDGNSARTARMFPLITPNTSGHNYGRYAVGCRTDGGMVDGMAAFWACGKCFTFTLHSFGWTAAAHRARVTGRGASMLSAGWYRVTTLNWHANSKSAINRCWWPSWTWTITPDLHWLRYCSPSVHVRSLYSEICTIS